MRGTESAYVRSCEVAELITRLMPEKIESVILVKFRLNCVPVTTMPLGEILLSANDYTFYNFAYTS